MDWSVFELWEWQVMTGITLFAGGMAWWTKKRVFRATALGGVAVIILAASILVPSPWWTVAGILAGALLLLLMAKQILEPTEEA